MPDKRLIDANALLEAHRCRLAQNAIKVENGAMAKPYSKFEAAIMECLAEYLSSAPTIDSVPVVRCKECKYRGYDDCPMCHDEYYYDEDDGGDWVTRDMTVDDGFCHKGAKMDGGEPHEENPHAL